MRETENLIVWGGAGFSLLCSSSDTTVTVSIAAVPNYAAVKTEVPSHGFSVTVPNACPESDGHVGVFERQLAHSGVQFSPSTQSRTPPDSTFTEGFKDGSQEVRVIALVVVEATNPPLGPPAPPPQLVSSHTSQPSDKRPST